MANKNTYISKNSHLEDEYISLYVDALLLNKVKELPAEVLEHVENCQVCKQSIIDAHEILKDISDLNTDKHPYFDNGKKEPEVLKKTNLSVLYRIVASIVFIISVGIIGFYILSNDQKPLDKISENIKKEIPVTDSIPKKVNLPEQSKTLTEKTKNAEKQEHKTTSNKDLKNLIADNKLTGEEFQVPPIMVSMLGTTTRSIFFEIKQPKDSTIFESSEQICFIWEGDIEEEIQVKIFNYKNKLIFESNIPDSNKFILNKRLQPGAYIWKIESSDELYHLGLFFITNN